MIVDFTKKMSSDEGLRMFADYMKDLSGKIGQKVSARGWCYIMEGERIINKDQFNKVAGWINRARQKGILPIDFIAEDEARAFSNIVNPGKCDITNHVYSRLEAFENCGDYYTPDYWEGEDVYIQAVVEKVDLLNLFMGISREYHIPIANAKGWSSMLQRAKYARRFKEAEDRGAKCVLLYFGDHDPDGLRIADTLRKNLNDVSQIIWGDGNGGYNPKNLKINRIGLKKSFIDKHRLTWIDNLITGSSKDLANPGHRNYKLPYVQDYLSKIGERKCEANSIMVIPDKAKAIFENAIIKAAGDDILRRFKRKDSVMIDKINQYMNDLGIMEKIEEIKELFD